MSPLDDLISRARRRSVWNLILTQVVFAFSVAMGGVVLLLVAGTQILDWPWLVFLFIGAFCFALYRIRGRIPSLYVVAQRLDRGLNLHDSISTAFFFRRLAGGRPIDAGMCEAQQRRAEELSRNVDIRRALPFVAPRSLRAAAGLALLACGLFGLRYGISRSLDLRPPIAQAVFDIFHRAAPERPLLAKNRQQSRAPQIPVAPGLTRDQAESENAKQLHSVPDSGTNTADIPDVSNESAVPYQSQNQPGEEADSSEEGNAEQSDASSGKPDQQADSSPPADRGEKSSEPPSAKQAPPANNENSSLMNKLRDAMADLLARLKIQPPPGESRQASADSQSGLRSGRERQTGKKGEPSAGHQQADRASGEEQESDQQGQGSERAQGAHGKSGDKGSDRQASREERSGVGKEEGSKELREAEQLAAMGKISEIIGKRSASVTGEVMVEVASGKQQQLKTPYSQSNAAHSDTGGEIHRDEVPLIYQNYVQRYFEQIRK